MLKRERRAVYKRYLVGIHLVHSDYKNNGQG